MCKIPTLIFHTHKQGPPLLHHPIQQTTRKRERDIYIFHTHELGPPLLHHPIQQITPKREREREE